MATLYYDDASLPLDLWEAAEKQRNGGKYEFRITTSMPVTRELYDAIFASLIRNKDLQRVLRRVTSSSLKTLWEEVHGKGHPHVGFPKGEIRITPCIHSLTANGVIVSMTLPIEKAKVSEVEPVLKKCIKKEAVTCKGPELYVVVTDVEIRTPTLDIAK